MKHTTLVVLFFLFILNVKAQTIDSIYEVMNPRTNNYWNQIERILPFDDTSFLAITLHGRFYKLNEKGQILWSSEIPYSNFNPVLIGNASIPYEALPGNLFIVTQEDQCDAIGDFEYYKFDLEGNYIEHFDLYPNSTGLSKIPNSFLLFPSANNLPKYLFTTNDSLIFWYSRDSMIFRPSVLQLQKGDINSRGDILLASSDSLYIYFNENGEFNLPLKIQYASDGIHKHWISWTSDSTFILRENKHLSLFDNSLHLLKDYTLLPQEKLVGFDWFKPFINMRVEKDSVNEILILDHELQEIFRTEFEMTNNYYDKLFWSPDSLLTRAGRQYYEGGEGFNYIKTFDFSADGVNYNYDVSISNATYNGFELIGDTTCMGYPVYDSYLVRNVQFSITNNSELPIHDVMITSTEPYCHFYCYPTPFFHRAISDINLLPGMTINISLGDIKLEQERQSNLKDLCLMVMLPDQHFDVNLTNNKSCLEETVSTHSIKDENKPKLYPNPAKEILYLNADEEVNSTWKIYNMDGKIIMEENNDFNPSKSIDISKLSQGTYILRLTNSAGSSNIYKFVKI